MFATAVKQVEARGPAHRSRPPGRLPFPGSAPRRRLLVHTAGRCSCCSVSISGRCSIRCRPASPAGCWSIPGSENDPAGFANYIEVLQSREFWSAVRVTVTYAASSIACGLALGTVLRAAAQSRFLLAHLLSLGDDDPDGDHPRGDRHLLEAALRSRKTGVFNYLLARSACRASPGSASTHVAAVDHHHGCVADHAVLHAGDPGRLAGDRRERDRCRAGRRRLALADVPLHPAAASAALHADRGRLPLHRARWATSTRSGC